MMTIPLFYCAPLGGKVVRQHQRGRALQTEGCGIAIGAASRQGSEGSARFQRAGSKGVVSPDGDEFYSQRYETTFPPQLSF